MTDSKATSGADFAAQPTYRRQRLRHAYARVRSGMWGDDPKGDGRDVWAITGRDFDMRHLMVADPPLIRRSMGKYFRSGRLIRSPALLMECVGGSERTAVGRTVMMLEDRRAVPSNYVAELQIALGYDPLFLAYLHLALHRAGRTRKYSYPQLVPHMNLDAFLRQEVIVPPQGAQQRIAMDLQRRRDAMREVCRLREQQIALARERTRAAAHGAMLKRRPWAPMSTSSSDLPNGWSVVPLSSVARVNYGQAFSAEDFHQRRLDDEMLPAVRLGQIGRRQLDMRQHSYVHARRVARGGIAHQSDVLIRMSGEVGQAAIVDRSVVAVNQRIAIVRPPHLARGTREPQAREDWHYLQMFLLSSLYREQLKGLTQHAGMPNVSLNQVRRSRIIWPPASERAAIAQALQTAYGREKSRIAALVRDMSLRKERFEAYLLLNMQV